MAFLALKTKIFNGRICHKPILVVYLTRLFLSVRKKSITENFVKWKSRPMFVLYFFSAFFHFKPYHRRTLQLFHSLIMSTLLVSKGLWCLYNKEIKHGCLSIWISLLVFNSIPHSFAAFTRELSSLTLEEKFHIYARPCFILYSSHTFSKQSSLPKCDVSFKESIIPSSTSLDIPLSFLSVKGWMFLVNEHK